jgi:hypothetical protein
MLSGVLAAITCLTFTVSEPLETPAQMPESTTSVSVGTHVTPTSFRTRNFSGNAYLLIFSTSAAVVEPVIVKIPSGGSVEYTFSPSELEGVSLEVVEIIGETLRTGGMHLLDVPTGELDINLWTVPAKPRLATWLQLGAEVMRLPNTGSLLPAGSTSEDPGTESAVIHTPVALPRILIGPGLPGEEYTPM